MWLPHCIDSARAFGRQQLKDVLATTMANVIKPRIKLPFRTVIK
jgi:hypothetical protein